ncbi:MAG TPA: hypothetical protein DDX19_17025 [Rhodopirellula baltica]|uniref:Uncharacterized protein n=1 Tax=Rhodopirellula baltica (strain DSM 10527 / NCIMB 13988 / SH1) TaxID=243090 RepID=Q7UKH5_RHOBA|nr:hypothetical protein RB10637 [Rhodopirellula baltica SH 1]HBE64406.1 hypothetical protein [Rhodopirellula baltica]
MQPACFEGPTIHRSEAGPILARGWFRFACGSVTSEFAESESILVRLWPMSGELSVWGFAAAVAVL